MGYASKRINRDPYPWCSQDIYGNLMDDRASVQRHPAFRDPDRYDPRPEYDNNYNPILVDMRKVGRTDWAEMLRVFEYVTSQAHHYITADWERITDPEHIEHARKVLTKLAASRKAERHGKIQRGGPGNRQGTPALCGAHREDRGEDHWEDHGGAV